MEVPRVGYPCVYVGQRFCAEHGVFDAVARVCGRLYPVLPCVMDPAYCSVWNGNFENRKEPKTLVLELLPAEAARRLRQAAEVRLSITNVSPEQFGGGMTGCDLESYAHERLDGGILQTG